MTSPTQQTWTGWHRARGGPWRAVATADTEAACWDRLLAVKEAGDKLVMRSGKHPDDRARQPGLFSGGSRP
jgi:hypothetical protein